MAHAFAILQPAGRSPVVSVIAVATQDWSSAETSEGYTWFERFNSGAQTNVAMANVRSVAVYRISGRLWHGKS